MKTWKMLGMFVVFGMMSVLMLGCEPNYQSCTLNVNYDLTLDEMIKAGKYNYVHDQITKDNFPINRPAIELGYLITKEVVLVCMKKKASAYEVIVHMKKYGLRSAQIEELLAFGRERPSVQREFPVVGFGSSWVDRAHHSTIVVPSLGGDAFDREVRLNEFDYYSNWPSNYCFLAVRK